MSEWTRRKETRQYTETIFYRDGDEIGRITNHDDISYDIDMPEPMTADEIEDFEDLT